METPVQAVYVHESNDTALFNHVLIVAEDHSSVTYVENYISTVNPKDAVFNIISEVITGDNASVTYGAVDTLSSGVTTYVNRRGARADATAKSSGLSA